jgi:hypothetical protein
LHLAASFLLFDGKQHERTFEMMREEGIFPRLLELIQKKPGEDDRLHRTLLDLLYEMSRIQRLRVEDMSKCGAVITLHQPFTNLAGRCAGYVDDAFVTHLFQIIEEVSDDANDPYHYPVIRVLVRQQWHVDLEGLSS